MKRVIAAIIKNSGNKYLLVSSKRDFGQFSRYYYPPAGKVEVGENDFECLRRELREELGLELLSVKFITETPGDIQNQTTAWYECHIDDYELKINEEELSTAGYFSLEEMRQLDLWPATKKFFEKYILD
ncbi:NUDIX hydrolase [Candidatus Kuenenbacteria bacterium]|nr:NUDIX hydrolase [Candidatus Kuenenbacteria bacterium]